MEKSLYEAAIAGNVPSLLNLLNDDPLLLDICAVGPYAKPPLHVACLLGHAEFVNEILSRRPQLASEVDSQGSSPLHLAAAKGYVTIVKRLLVESPQMCFSRDKFGRNPVHVSAIKGHVEVLQEMVRVRPRAALERMIGTGDTVLHLCVRNNRLEYLKVLVRENLGDEELINSKNDDDDTILHLAAADQQSETVNFLIKSTNMDTSSPNRKGLTALQVSARANAESPLKEWGQHCGKKPREDWFEKMRSALMVVAILTATMAFQVGVNPPGGFWQDTHEGNYERWHYAGSSIMADSYPYEYTQFLISNTVSFIASLSIILLLVSGLSLRRRLVMWILMLIMWAAIICNALTYSFSILACTPHEVFSRISSLRKLFHASSIVVLFWVGLMGLLLVVQIIRLVIPLVRQVWNKWNTRPRSTVSTGGARV